MVKITKTAAKEINGILEKQAKDAGAEGENFILRVGICGGGCAGFNYTLDLTTADTKTEQDEEFESHGIKIVVDPKSHLYLNGTEIDFKDELIGRGFVFNNPNSTASCGCGQSFSA